MTPSIRLLTPADARAYWHFRLDVLEREPRAFADTAAEHRATTVADAAARLAGADTWVLGVLAGARLRGMAALTRDGRRKTRHKVVVSDVYLEPDLRGRGLGRALMTAVVAHARTLAGVERLTLIVAAPQAAAQALYRAFGFVPWGCEPAAMRVGDEYLDGHYLALAL